MIEDGPGRFHFFEMSVGHTQTNTDGILENLDQKCAISFLYQLPPPSNDGEYKIY